MSPYVVGHADNFGTLNTTLQAASECPEGLDSKFARAGIAPSFAAEDATSMSCTHPATHENLKQC